MLLDLTRDITTMHDLTGDISIIKLQDLGSWNRNSLTGDGCIGPNCGRRGLIDLTRDISTFQDLTRDISTFQDLTRDISTFQDLTRDISTFDLQNLMGAWAGTGPTGPSKS